MKLARVIRLDESDLNVFETPGEAGEWAISGAFEFSNWNEDELKGKARQAFANGWLGLTTYGRSTFVAVARITEAEYESQVASLAQFFVERYGAPDFDAALPVAREELEHMKGMCEDQVDNALLVVSRDLAESGVREQFRVIPPSDAPLEAFAVHGDVDPIE